MRLFFIVFVAIIGGFLASNAIWALAAGGAIPAWVAVTAIVFLLLGILAIVSYLEFAKYDFEDRIRARRNSGSMTPGLFFAALYYGYSSASASDQNESSSFDASSGADYGGGGDGGGGD